MKVVFLSPIGHLGGSEVVLLDILKGLRSVRPEWTLRLIVGAEGPLVERATRIGVQVTVLRLPRSIARLGDAGAGESADWLIRVVRLISRLIVAIPAGASYVRELRRKLREVGPDIVHSNGLKMHILGAAARLSGIPLLWHIHDYVSARPITKRLLMRCASRCTAIIANSGSVRDDIRAVFGDRAKLCQIYNGVDLLQFAPHGAVIDLDGLAGLPTPPRETVRVGIVATLAKWKGHTTFLTAVSLLHETVPIRAYVIGDAIYRTEGSQYSLDELRTFARQLGISRKVGFTGFVEDVAAAIRTLDIVVHASTQPEPFGLIIAEAMACGRAVIVSQGGGAAEIVVDGKNGLSHPRGDAFALAERIADLARDPALRARIAESGRETVESSFSLPRFLSELIRVYEGVASSPA
jgi:glycosyltransferase involved in cell wall biosynthesis